MNYQEFRDLWHAALKAARLQIPYPISPTGWIDLRDMSRSYELIILRGGPYMRAFPLDRNHRIGLGCHALGADRNDGRRYADADLRRFRHP